MAIRFFLHNIKYRIPRRRKIKDCIKKIIADQGKRSGEINIILTSETHLLEINREFLKKDYYTDIITFDYSEKDFIKGELYISYEKVRENAKIFNVSKENELNRVIIHGILHLVGFNDKTDKEKKKIKKKEDKYLKILC